ncbi:hypothetical protein HPP92_012827 [Vanilla planifolia]|uniref:Uncharacterized protein n=1 Tax=Vanilla planifolia TaxID=51239 RepID=A0A835QUH3_VANPL|nr:hypothetical protein HPP92_013302 [Vanilla planifolia]KAG0478108.1 hypothetical protein HPP92_012827 [Vanilla planifolia]
MAAAHCAGIGKASKALDDAIWRGKGDFGINRLRRHCFSVVGVVMLRMPASSPTICSGCSKVPTKLLISLDRTSIA